MSEKDDKITLDRTLKSLDFSLDQLSERRDLPEYKNPFLRDLREFLGNDTIPIKKYKRLEGDWELDSKIPCYITSFEDAQVSQTGVLDIKIASKKREDEQSLVIDFSNVDSYFFIRGRLLYFRENIFDAKNIEKKREILFLHAGAKDYFHRSNIYKVKGVSFEEHMFEL